MKVVPVVQDATIRNQDDTLDGRNPAPVELGSLSHSLRPVLAPSKRWLALGFLNHQQYETVLDLGDSNQGAS